MSAFIEQALCTLEWGMCFLVTDFPLAAIRHPDTMPYLWQRFVWFYKVEQLCHSFYILYFRFFFYLYEFFFKENFIKRNFSVHIYIYIQVFINTEIYTSMHHYPVHLYLCPIIHLLCLIINLILLHNLLHSLKHNWEKYFLNFIAKFFHFIWMYRTSKRNSSKQILFLPGYLRCRLISC